MHNSIYVICDCYSNDGYDCNSFINTVLYIKRNACDINDEINIVIEEGIFERYRNRLLVICDNIFTLKLGKDIYISNYQYCELVYEVLKDRKCELVFTPSGITGRAICAWLSGKFHAGVTADVFSIEHKGEDIYYKRATTYNNLVAGIVCKSIPQVASVQAPAGGDDYLEDCHAKIISIEMNSVMEDQKVERSGFLNEVYDMSNTVIGIGRGVGNKERERILNYGTRHGIPIVGTRPLIEAGVLPYVCQVGQSGKSISCNRYIAIGISGMIQHLVGIINCKEVIAINPDKSAPIHERADVSIYLKAVELF